LAARDSVGLLFSTSSAKESHEWAGFQAGVFSHEVRSGLYGAADANGDGQVSYREMAAFIDRANASIANERYRSEVFARPPKDSDVLMDLRNRMGARVDVRGARSDHYFLEDSRGIRIADFHNDSDQQGYLLRPISAGRLYLRRTSDDSEFTIPTSPEVVALANLTLQEPRMRTRGAANDAFQSLFALPFGQRVVQNFRFDTMKPRADAPERSGSGGARVRRYTGVALLSVGVLSAAAGVYSLESAHALGASRAGVSQWEAARTNEQIHSRNIAGAIGFGVAGVAAGAGLLLVLWPEGHTTVAWDAGLGGPTMGVHGRF
jgi:hypothetical protein